MTDVEKCELVSFEIIFQKLGIQTQQVGNEFLIVSPDSGKISKGGYRYNPSENAVFDNSGKGRPCGGPFAFVKNYLGATTPQTVDWFSQNGMIKKGEREKNVPNVKKFDIYQNPQKFLIGDNFSSEILLACKTWLKYRGFSQDSLDTEAGEKRIRKVFKDFGYVYNPSTKKVDGEWIKSKPCIIFPGKNISGEIVNVKMRRIDNSKEHESDKSKSINISGKKQGIKYVQGVLFHDLDFILSQEKIIITEGEPDYVILRMLGFDNVIGNINGSANARNIIKEFAKNTKEVVVAYDFDDAGKTGFNALCSFCKKQMIYPNYQEKYDENGKKYKDLNDYFCGGDTKADFEKMFEKKGENTLVVYENKETQKYLNALENRNPLIYIRNSSSFYDTAIQKYVSMQEAVMNTGIKANDLIDMKTKGEIQTYYDLCYRFGGKEYHYNTLDEDSILKPSNNPVLHDDLKRFIENLAGGKKDDYDWIYKAILYKHSHINDVLVPALVITSDQGVGKGTFINLLSAIFGRDNTQYGIRTLDLLGDKDAYQGNKIIVEMDEIEAGNHKEAKMISAKLKNYIFKNPMPCRAMHKDFRNIDNLAWFIIASNDTKPILLDAGLNRRYMIVEGGIAINKPDNFVGEYAFEDGYSTRLNEETIKNKEIMSDFLAWLYQEFPEVPNMNRIYPLENDSKKFLEDISKSTTHKFFEWFIERYPNILRISNREKDVLVQEYRIEMQEDGYDYNHKYDKKYFTSSANLPRYVKPSKARIRGKSVNGFLIKGGGDTANVFPDNTIENKIINF